MSATFWEWVSILAPLILAPTLAWFASRDDYSPQRVSCDNCGHTHTVTVESPDD